MTGLFALGAGLAAGSAHVLSGPDHLAAVLPLAVARPGGALRAGAAWGLGHGLGVGALGLGGQLLRGHLPVDVDAASAAAELLVGALLLVVGGWALARSRGLVAHDRCQGPHLHLGPGHRGSAGHPGPSGHLRSAFGFGLLHGAAGTGHLLGVLPSLALGPAAAAAYLGAYLVAAIGAMAAFSALAGHLGPRLRHALPLSGLLSIAVGLGWLWTGWSA